MPYRLDTETQVFLYMDEFYCLSNFAAFRLQWKGLDFDTSEHAYQWEKFQDPGDADIQCLIHGARSAHEAFKIAEAHYIYVRPYWPTLKVEIMRQILHAKLGQHEYVRRKLLETGDRELIEDSWRSAFWGWGPHKDGRNMLGKLWMEIRDELRKEAR